MYKMCAEATAGQGELLWHVLAQNTSSHTLCGKNTGGEDAALIAATAAADRYCPPCLAAFRSAIQHHADASREPRAASAGSQ
ncbi:hypothetical protein ACFWUZ_19840 [Streptomyces sp. NPDC058646]|uniref:hypothetical protein n=1 Tax=Streptomyces sp. NPDC058646 TaxID=3346574 RepID=UPI003655E527